MATPTVPHSPANPLVETELRLVNSMFAAIFGQPAESTEPKVIWHTCSYESPESSRGACDGGYPCYERATVHSLTDDQGYCLKHFEQVSR